jgi:sporulation protein YlmC with PRC-barrel domain
MLQSIGKLYGERLGTSDGEIGRVKDFYFDEQNWAVRYLVADTGTWLTSRQVLISPYAIGSLYEDGKVMLVNLTRKQIEDSPSIATHKPVSRQYEEQYHSYYGWPYYWEGDGLWGGMRSFPILQEPPNFLPGGQPVDARSPHKRADAHLRSTQAVKGYHLQASDGIVGHVSDFMMDDESWVIGRLVIKTGHRFTGKEVLIPTSKVNRISYDESTVFVNLTKEAVEQSPERQLVPNDAIIAAEPILTI